MSNTTTGPLVLRDPRTYTVTVDDQFAVEPMTFDTSVSKTLGIRTQVAFDGTPASITSWTTSRNAHGATDTATICVPVKGHPQWSEVLYRDENDERPVMVEIVAGFLDLNGTPHFKRRFYGVVTSFEPDFDQGQMVTTFDCRSLGGILVDTKVTSAFQGQSTTDFVTACAAAHGLRTSITLRPGQPPETLASVFAHELLVGIHNMGKWDVLIKCAEVDDVDVWVRDDVLHYEAPDAIFRPPITLRYGRDTIGFKGRHAVQFAKGIEVEVRTYSPKTRVSVNSRTSKSGATTYKTSTSVTTPQFGTASASHVSITTDSDGTTSSSSGTVTTGGGGFSSGPTSIHKESSRERYVFKIPNLSKDECDRRAVKYWRQISAHEYGATWGGAVTPAIVDSLDVTALFTVTKVPWSKFDQGYYPRTIDEHFVIPQSDDAADGAGWYYETQAVNHRLPQGAV